MKLFPTSVRRVAQNIVAGGGVNVATEVRPGARARNVIDLLLDPLRAGHTMASGPTTVAMPTRPTAEAKHHVNASTIDANEPAIQARTITTSDFTAAPGLPGIRLGPQTITLNRTSGAATVTETAVGGRTDWANDANALGNTASAATIAGNVLGARGGQLEFTFPAWTGKDHLTITSVELHYYVSQSGTVLDNGDLRLAHGFPTLVDDLVITGNDDYTTTPYVVDLSSEVSVLSDLDDLEVAVRFESSVAQTFSATCARALVVVEATDTITP